MVLLLVFHFQPPTKHPIWSSVHQLNTHKQQTVFILHSVSVKYEGLSDKSSINWFGPVKIMIGPEKHWLFLN